MSDTPATYTPLECFGGPLDGGEFSVSLAGRSTVTLHGHRYQIMRRPTLLGFPRRDVAWPYPRNNFLRYAGPAPAR